LQSEFDWGQLQHTFLLLLNLSLEERARNHIHRLVCRSGL